MKDFWNNIKFEISILGNSTKVLLKVFFYVLILGIVYKITLPLIKDNLPKHMTLEDYENISGFVIIGLVFLSLVISKFLGAIFKNHKK